MSETRTRNYALVKSDTATKSKGKLKAKETSQTLVAANEHRVSLYVCNPSSKEVRLALGETAEKEEGIWLKKESGTVVIDDYLGIVSCITTSGEGELSYTEI